MSHSCARYPLAHHFGGRPKARALFDHFRRALERFGPVRVVSNKTGLGFMVRVRFAGVTYVGKDWLRCGMWLTRRVRSRRWVRVDYYPPRAYIHRFELREPADLDAEIRRHLRESYAVGCQLHLSDGLSGGLSGGLSDRAGPRRRPSR
jgi:hypothetical protein